MPQSPVLTSATTRRAIRLVAVAGVFAFSIGCETKSFLDPSEVGRFDRQPLVMPILSTLDVGVEEPNREFLNAAPATSADLLAERDDYRMQRGDLVNISITDLYAPGVETVKTTRVSESGRISLPYIGQIAAMDQTEADLEQLIAKAYADANIITRAQVSVTVAEARGRVFSLLGGIARPGQYAIVSTDFRVLDALVLGGDVSSPFTRELLVIRPQKPTSASPSQSTPAAAPAGAPTPTDLAPRSDAGRSPVVYLQATSDAAPGRYIIVDGKPVLVDGSEADVADAAAASAPASLEPAAPEVVPQPVAETPAPTPAPAGEAPAQVASPAAEAPAPITPPGATASNGAFEFRAETSTGTSRVIRVDLEALKTGDLTQNIVIRPNDLVFVPPITPGVYYMGGHVNRPGVFSLAGQDVTLKQAVIAAGMLDGLAVPKRTDVIRRVGKDRELYARVDLDKIFAGGAPDILLKPDDQILVGTNALAPFLFAIRNGFRFVYGFGFIWDRNLADSTDTFVN